MITKSKTPSLIGLVSGASSNDTGPIAQAEYSRHARIDAPLSTPRRRERFGLSLLGSLGTLGVLACMAAPQMQARTRVPLQDFDGDGKADYVVYSTLNLTFYIQLSSNGTVIEQQWGTTGDQPISGDFDGDGRSDIAIFRPSNATWYIRRSSDGSLMQQQWGIPGDLQVVGDHRTHRVALAVVGLLTEQHQIRILFLQHLG